MGKALGLLPSASSLYGHDVYDGHGGYDQFAFDGRSEGTNMHPMRYVHSTGRTAEHPAPTARCTQPFADVPTALHTPPCECEELLAPMIAPLHIQPHLCRGHRGVSVRMLRSHEGLGHTCEVVAIEE